MVRGGGGGGGGGERALSFGIQINEGRRNRGEGGPTLEITLKIGMVCFVLTPVPYCSTDPFSCLDLVLEC